MDFEIWILVASALLQLSLVLTHANSIAVSPGIAWGTGRRDTEVKSNDFTRRAERCVVNTMESLFVFMPLVLVVLFANIDSGLARGSMMSFLGARVAHAAIYLANIPKIRSLVWWIGNLCLFVLIYEIVVFGLASS